MKMEKILFHGKEEKMEIIKTVDLTKRYNNLTAVDHLNLEIKKGELFSLLGINGAGKTTTIKMMSCLTKPTSGDVLVKGHSVLHEAENVKRMIGVSPQETAVASNLSVQENLAGVLLRGSPTVEKFTALLNTKS